MLIISSVQWKREVPPHPVWNRAARFDGAVIPSNGLFHRRDLDATIPSVQSDQARPMFPTRLSIGIPVFLPTDALTNVFLLSGGRGPASTGGGTMSTEVQLTGCRSIHSTYGPPARTSTRPCSPSKTTCASSGCPTILRCRWRSSPAAARTSQGSWTLPRRSSGHRKVRSSRVARPLSFVSKTTSTSRL